MKIPKVNPTVAAVREAWAGIEARRAARQTPGGGRGEPMAASVRAQGYWLQTDRDHQTPRQMRRFNHKYNRTLRVLEG